MQFKLNSAEHPGKPALLAWAEGELPWWRAWIIGRHVRSCWQCKGQVRELEDLVCAVTLGIEQLPEPSRLDTAKALWRFRQACLELEDAPRPQRFRLSPAWTAAASLILATVGLAYVANWPRFQLATDKSAAPARSLHPARPAEPAGPANADANRPGGQPAPLRSETTRALDLPPGPTEEDLVTAEIQALAALHRSRFCLTSGIEVRRAGSVVEIKGTVLSGDQRDRIAGILNSVSHGDLLRILLTQPAEAPDGPPSPGEVRPQPDPDAAAAPPPLVAWLRRNLGVGSRRTERDMFNLMNSMALESERASSESWALRHLADQFPLSRTRQWKPELQDQLLQMVDDHAIALANDLQRLESRLTTQIGVPPSPNGTLPSPRDYEHWQDRVLALHTMVEDVVRPLLASMSTGSGTPPPASAPAPDFSELFQTLGTRTGNCLSAASGLRADLQRRTAEARRSQTTNPTH